MIVDWDKKIIQLFRDFADEDFQRRSWFGLGPEVSSPGEMCCWLDDLDLSGWCDKNKEKLGTHLFQFICDFEAEIDALPDDEHDWAFSSLGWIRLRLMASVIRDMLEQKFE